MQAQQTKEQPEEVMGARGASTGVELDKDYLNCSGPCWMA